MSANLRIVSDGTPSGTHVYDHEGHEIEKISAVTWWVGVDDVARAALTFSVVEVELEAEAEVEQLTLPFKIAPEETERVVLSANDPLFNRETPLVVGPFQKWVP